MAEVIFTQSQNQRSHFLVFVLRTYLTLVLPVLLVLISVRLVMTPLFLQVEYPRPGFPVDYYGFTIQDRLDYGPYALNYLLNGETIDYLGNLKFPDGTNMYNVRELHHMRDVKIVTQWAFRIAIASGALTFIFAFTLWRNTGNHVELYRGLFNGSVLTLGIVATIIISAFISWDLFFTGFHTIFFASGTWRFEYSDTLIRLFPEQFWFDAAITIGVITVTGAILIMFLSWNGLSNLKRHNFDTHASE